MQQRRGGLAGAEVARSRILDQSKLLSYLILLPMNDHSAASLKRRSPKICQLRLTDKFGSRKLRSPDGGMDIDVAEVVEVEQLTVASGVSRCDATKPTLQEPLRESAKSATSARQLTFASGELRSEPPCEKTRSPTLPEPPCEKVESADSAGEQATRDVEELHAIQKDVEKLGSLEPSTPAGDRDEVDVELARLLEAMTVDRKLIIEEESRCIMSLIDELGGSKRKTIRESGDQQ